MAATAPNEEPVIDDPDRQESIDHQNREIQKHLFDLYAKEADFDKWLDNTDKYLRALPQKERECNLDLYAYAQNIVEYHRYVRRQKEERQSHKIPQSQWESPFISTRLRVDPNNDRGAILRASDRPELPADQQAFLKLFCEQSKRGQRLRRLEEASYSQLYNHKTWKHVDEGKAKTLRERIELRAKAEGYQRAALQAILRKHIYHKEQDYVGSWENNIVRLPRKPRPRLEAKLEEPKRVCYKWTNKFLHFHNRRSEDADKARALRELVRPLYRNKAVPTDDIAVTLIRNQILKENIDLNPSTAKPEPASQVWGFPLPDELKPVEPENYFAPGKTNSTNGGKRKATAGHGHGPRSKRPRNDSNSLSEDKSEYGHVPLGSGKIMPPEIRDFWMSPEMMEQERVKNVDIHEKIYAVEQLPFFYLAETNYLAFLKSRRLEEIAGHINRLERTAGDNNRLERTASAPDKDLLPEAPERLGGQGGRKLPYWVSVPGRDNPLLELPWDRRNVNNWEPDSAQLTGIPSTRPAATATHLEHDDDEQPLPRRPDPPEAQVDPQLQEQEEVVESGNVPAPSPTFPPPFYQFRESQLHSRKN